MKHIKNYVNHTTTKEKQSRYIQCTLYVYKHVYTLTLKGQMLNTIYINSEAWKTGEW